MYLKMKTLTRWKIYVRKYKIFPLGDVAINKE